MPEISLEKRTTTTASTFSATALRSLFFLAELYCFHPNKMFAVFFFRIPRTLLLIIFFSLNHVSWVISPLIIFSTVTISVKHSLLTATLFRIPEGSSSSGILQEYNTSNVTQFPITGCLVSVTNRFRSQFYGGPTTTILALWRTFIIYYPRSKYAGTCMAPFNSIFINDV